MRTMAIRLFAAAVGLIALSAPRVAEAETPDSDRITLQRGPGTEQCMGLADLLARVQERLGRPPREAATASGVSIALTIERATPGPGWHATMMIVEDTGALAGTRKMSDPQDSCDGIGTALAIATALALGEDACPGCGAQPARAAEGAPTSSVSGPKGESPSGLTLLVAPAAALAVGSLPRAQVGPAVALRLGLPRGPTLGLEGAFFPNVDADAPAAGGATFRMWALGALACAPLFDSEAWRLAACAGGEAEATSFRAFGFVRDRSDTRWSASVLLGARLEQQIHGALTAFAGADLGVPMHRESYDYIDATGAKARLFRPWPVTATLKLGVGYRFR